MKDELIAQHQSEKPENVWIDEQSEIYGELTAEQEDFLLEEALERERELRHPNPTRFELTIQRLRKEKEEKGWTSMEFYDKLEEEASFELAEYKRELELSYGID